ncbi:prepilin-type N-terminal cleavage/methylation domain-containing protein [Campylobacter fetus]|nr:prepilin-type N-terminal cleavage/methylation domain-containing protein [Campylobacter fetus]
MKKAFTLIELVIVLVIVGIMAFFTVPKLNRNDLRLAADQIVSHIRYTQHLAIIDDKFNQSDPDWYKGRWQIFFTKTNQTENKQTYNIFNDKIGGSSGFPNKAELAKNPLNPSKYMSSGYAGAINFNSIEASKELNLEDTYSIKDVKLQDGCSKQGAPTRITFDELGRPYKGNVTSNARHSQDLITTICTIKLIHTNNDCIFIKVTPITGFAYVELAASKADCNK